MNIFEAVLLGAIEGFTEFLPVSSTGHLTIVEKLLGYTINDSDITAFTAIIQSGAVLATLIFLRKDLIRIVGAWLGGPQGSIISGLVGAGGGGVFNAGRRDDPDYRFGWAIILGSLPIGIVGLLFKDTIEHTLRSLWFVGASLILFSGVMWFADRAATLILEGGISEGDTIIVDAPNGQISVTRAAATTSV